MALPPSPSLSPALALLLALLGATPGLGAPGGSCQLPPPAWCRSWETALRCGALGRCARLAWAPPGTDVCADCQQLVTIVIHMANESATRVAVEGFLRRECAALQVAALVPHCQELVAHYFGLLVTSLEGHLKPSAICARLDLCPPQPGGTPALPALWAPSTHPQVTLPLPLCWLCRTFLARAEATIPVGSVATAVAGLCRALPVAVAGACQCLAQRYAALALEGALGHLAPRLLCRLLLSCGPKDGDGDNDTDMMVAPGGVAPAGEKPDPGHPLPALSLSLSPERGPCALGPLYWCSSPAAAQQCQALQHCQEHIWL